MELKDYLAIISRRKKIILGTLVATLNVVIIGLLVTTPVYPASSTLRIATASGGTVNYSDYMYADRLMNTYVSIATSSPVLDELKQQLGLVECPPIEVKTVPNTELIQILVEDPDPALAATAANTLTSILITQSQDLYSGGGKSPQDILSEQLQQIETEQAAESYPGSYGGTYRGGRPGVPVRESRQHALYNEAGREGIPTDRVRPDTKY